MPNFIRSWLFKRELKFWKCQLESLANDIEYSKDSKLIKDKMYLRYCEYEKVVDVLDNLLMNNI